MINSNVSSISLHRTSITLDTLSALEVGKYIKANVPVSEITKGYNFCYLVNSADWFSGFMNSDGGSTWWGIIQQRSNSANNGNVYKYFSTKAGADSVAPFRNGNATVSQVLSGYTFSNASSSDLTGSMINRGAWTSTPTSSTKVSIPVGYHNGSGYVDTSVCYSNGVNTGSNIAINFINNTGFGRTDKITTFPDYVIVRLNNTIAVTGNISPYTNFATSNILVYPYNQTSLSQNTSIKFDAVASYVSHSCTNYALTFNIKGIKRGVGILNISVGNSDASIWYTRYIAVFVV